MKKKILVKGKKTLSGEINVSGSKNCALTLIAASLLINEKVIINNVPNIEDIRLFIKIINYLNVKTIFENNKLIIDASNITVKDLMLEEITRFRASYYLLGALLNKTDSLKISHFGGCNFVKRPINYHRDLFSHFGVNSIEKEEGYLFVRQNNNNEEYTLPYPSFGTSINAVLYAISSNQETVLHNVTTEIEFVHFVMFLKQMGADISLNESTVIVKPSKLHGGEFDNIPDRIEAGTFLLMGPVLCDYLKVNNICPYHNKGILDLLSLLDVKYELDNNSIILRKQEITKSVFVETDIKNQISSDLQPILSVFCLNIKRISVIKEGVYPSRFTHVEPLKKMGGFITLSNQNILINGIMDLYATDIEITDLRMGAALVFAALNAEGVSKISNLEYIERGYENFVDKLISIGADITYEI